MKKIITVLLLTGLLIFTGIGFAFGQEETEAPADLIEYDYEELHVASTTPMSGNFFNSIWGNNTSDIDVRMLLHGYDLVNWNNEEGMFMLDDTVVSGIIVTENRAGDRTYTLALYNDLTYSDGTPITAWDYAFAVLLEMSPEAAQTGAVVKRPDYLVGYEDYISGRVPYLAGFRVVADDQMAITVKAEYLPFFYELGLLSCVPYPISVIAPGVRVADDGNGIYLTNIGSGEPVFTADLLRRTVLDPQTGYMSHPAVTSGPYKLVSFENGKASFEVNEYFKGDSQGNTPQITRLTYETISNDEIIPAYSNGTVGLLNKITASSTIDAGMAAIRENADQLAFTNYLRTGLGFISFNGENAALSEQPVRQAIAYLVDKDAFVESTVGNYGLRVDGYYGMGQWMYQILMGAISYPIDDPAEGEITEAEYEEQLEKWEELSLDDIPVYEFDPEAAAALLNGAGWNLNADGGAYEAGVRYKQTADGLTPLRLKLACPEGTPAIDALHAAAESLAEGGIEVEISSIPFSDLLEQFYNMTERSYDLFFLTSNFDILFDPSVKFIPDGSGLPVWAETGIGDQELYDLAVAMRSTEPGDLLSYCETWLEFQQRFEEVLPLLPLYSNTYFDFYPRVLHEYNVASNVAWSQAIVPAYMSDVIEEAPEELEGGEPEFIDASGLIEIGD